MRKLLGISGLLRARECCFEIPEVTLDHPLAAKGSCPLQGPLLGRMQQLRRAVQVEEQGGKGSRIGEIERSILPYFAQRGNAICHNGTPALPSFQRGEPEWLVDGCTYIDCAVTEEREEIVLRQTAKKCSEGRFSMLCAGQPLTRNQQGKRGSQVA